MNTCCRTLLATVLLSTAWLHAPPAWPAPAAPFVMGTIQTDETYSGKWVRKIYGEAFRRLGVRLEVTAFPTQRLSVLTDHAGVDGDVARVYGYAAAHADLVRVEEPVMEVVLALFTTDSSRVLKRLEDLPASGLRGIYLRGVAICENTLRPLLTPDRLTDTTEESQGLSMMLAGRADFYCTSDLSMQTLLRRAEFKEVRTLRKLLVLNDALAFYPYLHRKHAELAPRLAAVLKQMKAEGLIERYRLEALEEVERK